MESLAFIKYANCLQPVEEALEVLKKYLKALKKDTAGPTLPPLAVPPVPATVTPQPSTDLANNFDKLYDCSWFRKVSLLIYLLFLKVAAVALYVFAYNQNSVYLTVNAPSEAIIYLSWLAVDIGAVCLFAMVALHWPIWDYYRSRGGNRPDEETLRKLMLRHQNIASSTTSDKANRSTKWWILLFLCLLPSVVFSYFSINNALSDSPTINVP